MEGLLPPSLWHFLLQSILDSMSSPTYILLLSNVCKFVGTHCPSPDFFTVGVYTVIPMGGFRGMGINMYVHPAVLNLFGFKLD